MIRHPAGRWGLRALRLLVVLALLASTCAAGANPQAGSAAGGGMVAGLWLGPWHGIIAPVAFGTSLFIDGVRVCDVHDSGARYDLGFVLGLSFLVGEGSSGVRGAAQ